MNILICHFAQTKTNIQPFPLLFFFFIVQLCQNNDVLQILINLNRLNATVATVAFEHLCFFRFGCFFFLNLPMHIVLANKFTALIRCSGHSVCTRSGITMQGFALVCCDFLFYRGRHVRLNWSRHTWEQPIFFPFLFVENKSALCFGVFFWLPDSCQVIPSDRVPSVRCPLPVTLPSVCCCLGPPAWARTRSRSYASAPC